jgi:hypothetical protein
MWVGFAREELIDAAGGLAAFRNRPNHQRLAAAHIAGGKDAKDGSHLTRVGLDC